MIAEVEGHKDIILTDMTQVYKPKYIYRVLLLIVLDLVTINLTR